MSERVFILATCKNEELSAYTEMVFRTLRVGFPTAEVEVFINEPMPVGVAATVANEAKKADCRVMTLHAELKHHEWIEQLVKAENDAFWICDTDIIFYESMERQGGGTHLYGAYMPEFQDEFTNAITRSRLHTSLLRIDPQLVRFKMDAYFNRHPDTIFNPRPNLFHPLYMPLRQRTVFYDTCSMLFHAIGGAYMPQCALDKYFHFHFGTCADVVLPNLKNAQQMIAARREVMKNNQLGRGGWRAQLEYLEARKPNWDGQDVIAPITDENAESARDWCVALCNGNPAAMSFCDLWYRYCHAIDDLIDTLEDGRPTMAKDQIISIFFTAALLYNCEFYQANRTLLGPIVLQVTNTYRDSVAWENASASHLRAMADVFRTCGNEMFVMVALICGGESHMRKMSMAIKERDWLGQHCRDGRPL